MEEIRKLSKGNNALEQMCWLARAAGGWRDGGRYALRRHGW